MSLSEKLAAMPAALGALLGLLLLAGAASVHLNALPFPQSLALYLIPALLAGWTAGRWAGILLSVAGAAAYAGVGLRIYGGPALTAASALDAAAALMSLLLVSLPAAFLRRARDRESQFSRNDPLTGVFNLRYFMERAEAEMKRARRSRQPAALAYLDIDNLREVNELLGFIQGDRLLRSFALDLRHHTRSSDIIARLGGDEFVIMFPETGVDQARGAAAKIHKAFQAVAGRENCQATLSVGLVTVFNPELELEAAMKQASDMLLQAKGDGGNTVREGTLG
jgi:diguanylate cyclase (GGDEF)-like protein